MIRAFIVIITVCIALGACTQRLICPAYQSAFIYDKEAMRKKFSYLNEDSTPKVFTASKTKYLIAEPTSYHKKVRSLQTVEMKQIHPVVPDSLRDDYVSLAELDSAARTIIDSTYIVDVNQEKDNTKSNEDSVYVITKDKELRLLKYNVDSLKYNVVQVRLNVDQDNYLWYLRNSLVLPDVRLANLQKTEKAAEAGKKKGFFGFFKNLFKKKKKEPVDSASLKPPIRDENDFDYVDTLAVAKPAAQQQQQTKKKGIFSFLKKDKTKAKTVTPDKPKQAAQDDAAEPAQEEKPAKKKKNKKGDTPEPDQAPAEPDKKEEKKDDGF